MSSILLQFDYNFQKPMLKYDWFASFSPWRCVQAPPELRVGSRGAFFCPKARNWRLEVGD